MAVNFGNGVTTISSSWTSFKAVALAKAFAVQYLTEGATTTVFGFDGAFLAYTTMFWNGVVPDGVINGGYTQEQNDADKADFEANFLASANRPIVPLTATGISGQAPAKGLGGFAPDPSNNPYQPDPDEVVSLYADGEGQTMVRGSVLTDEGSIRDDFTGTALETDLTGTVTFTNGSTNVTGVGTLFTQEVTRDFYVKITTDDYTKWVAVVRAPNDTELLLESPYAGATASGTAHKARWIPEPVGATPGTVSVGSSNVTLSSGTATNCGVCLWRDGDYLPMSLTLRGSISQRIADQVGHFGFRDVIHDQSMYCDVVLDGTDDTVVKFRSAWDADEQLTTVALPAGFSTSQVLTYKIDVLADYCALTINGVLVAKHSSHIPDAYAVLMVCSGWDNLAEVTNTDMVIDTVFFSNHDQLQIASSFTEPVPIIHREDQHNLGGSLTTTATTADQTILSYDVPVGKVMYIVGYSVSVSGSTTGTIKLGHGDISTEAASPGALDGAVFRTFEIASGDKTQNVDFAIPRKIGVGGNTVVMAVTPADASTAVWRGYIDFVLR